MDPFVTPGFDSEDWELGRLDLDEEMDLNELNDIFSALKRDMELEEDVAMQTIGAPDITEPWSQLCRDIFSDAEVKWEAVSPGSPASLVSAEDVDVKGGPPTPPSLPGDVPCPPLHPTASTTTATTTATLTAIKPQQPCGPAACAGAPTATSTTTTPALLSPVLVPRVPVSGTLPVVLLPASHRPAGSATSSTIATQAPGAVPAATVFIRCIGQALSPAGKAVIPSPVTGKPIVMAPSQATTKPIVNSPSPVAAKPIVPAPSRVTGKPIIMAPSQATGKAIITSPSPLAGKAILPASAPLAAVPAAHAGPDEQVWRRQQRMMRNRESACQSRARKRQQLQQLESQLRAALGANAALRNENAALRERLAQLLTLTQAGGGGSAARTTRAVCAMAILVLIVVNFGPLGDVPGGVRPAPPRLPLPPLPRRRLLGYEGGASDTKPPNPGGHDPVVGGNRQHAGVRWADSELVLRSQEGVVILPQSCSQLNSTEILRLSAELHGWILRHERERNRTVLTPTTRSTAPRRPARRSPPLIPAIPTESGTERALGRPLQVPDEWRWRRGRHFLEAIGRRDDTFYVVSFRRDHLLLPARAHNHTQRPRMSLLMPAMAPHNESVLEQREEDEAMMQIDCEVTNTRLLSLKTHASPSSSSTSSTSSPPSSLNTESPAGGRIGRRPG